VSSHGQIVIPDRVHLCSIIHEYRTHPSTHRHPYITRIPFLSLPPLTPCRASSKDPLDNRVSSHPFPPTPCYRYRPNPAGIRAPLDIIYNTLLCPTQTSPDNYQPSLSIHSQPLFPLSPLVHITSDSTIPIVTPLPNKDSIV